MMRSTISRVLAGALLLGGVAGQAAAQLENLPGAVDALRGRHWHGGECCGWTWDWVQQSGPTFSGSFSNPNGEKLQEANIVISINGDNVRITRGNGACVYTGKIHVGGASGTYTCGGRPAGPWAATIYQTAPTR
ncbi:hypothetical protein [Rugamonas rubra]|jgi:hypothetical protein|uniref:Uncharacterized protein n=1 Tax=Rugamonas rubra TaxID=758825 RepID=A0A1I4RUH8_9BURK|nr:hypothetical protein [Rugamonas rubra]SFM55734.1 hypothetical protein SAMN02982985_04488 [Rugamonas rubra]